VKALRMFNQVVYISVHFNTKRDDDDISYML